MVVACIWESVAEAHGYPFEIGRGGKNVGVPVYSILFHIQLTSLMFRERPLVNGERVPWKRSKDSNCIPFWITYRSGTPVCKGVRTWADEKNLLAMTSSILNSKPAFATAWGPLPTARVNIIGALPVKYFWSKQRLHLWDQREPRPLRHGDFGVRRICSWRRGG
jgi:hypothetical protein